MLQGVTLTVKTQLSNDGDDWDFFVICNACMRLFSHSDILKSRDESGNKQGRFVDLLFHFSFGAGGGGGGVGGEEKNSSENQGTKGQTKKFDCLFLTPTILHIRHFTYQNYVTYQNTVVATQIC